MWLPYQLAKIKTFDNINGQQEYGESDLFIPSSSALFEEKCGSSETLCCLVQ